MSLIKKRSKIISGPFLLLIWLYQNVVSPFLPSSCLYYPSCSEYARQAFIKHGVVKGAFLTAKRLLRCHPFCQGGVDEVPEIFSLLRTSNNG